MLTLSLRPRRGDVDIRRSLCRRWTPVTNMCCVLPNPGRCNARTGEVRRSHRPGFGGLGPDLELAALAPPEHAHGLVVVGQGEGVAEHRPAGDRAGGEHLD